MSKQELKIAELEAKAEDMRAEGCERLADIFEKWAEDLKIKQLNKHVNPYFLINGKIIKKKYC